MRQSLCHLSQLTAIVVGLGSIHLFTILNFKIDFSIYALLKAYSINMLLALLGYWLIRLAYHFKTQVEGFIFLLLSFVKFGILYFVFLANDSLNFGESRLLFFHLFIPYIICLVWEITVLAKILNQTAKKQA